MVDQTGSFYFPDQNDNRNPYLTIERDSFIYFFARLTQD